MSGCENPLDSPSENRAIEAFQAIHGWNAMGAYCLKDGGLAVEHRLRRVTRKLPILGSAPQQDRLSPVTVRSYVYVPKVSRSKEGRPPALPLDSYLSWMSPFCGLSNGALFFQSREPFPFSGVSCYRPFTNVLPSQELS